MWRPILTRLLSSLGVLWLSVSSAFVALQCLPGRIEDILAGDTQYPGMREAIIREWGLDRSLPVQYLDFLGRLLHGNLGTSYIMRTPVAELLRSQLWPTLQLALSAGALAVALAIVVGVATAGRRPRLRWVASTVEQVATSTPVFWVGILLLMLFSFHWHWFPVSGAVGWRSLVLPAVTLALPSAGILAHVLREAMEQALEQPFITTARARGLSETGLRYRHVLRHGLLPIITLGGWLVGGLLGGAVITEKVFGRPGLGTVTLNAITAQDVPVVLAVVLMAAFIYVMISTVLDIVCLFIDPRLRNR
ncbi:ABC transporter permease [Pseudomonas sp. dw_358]|uniref:ABC transporter permease n=1 Tax=Pseudomonas sp. dw_358 TaxID=2720083 RepID=UPI001BD283E0|nr:ABC transporter permease [Pseudomonas sp. dw_358]